MAGAASCRSPRELRDLAGAASISSMRPANRNPDRYKGPWAARAPQGGSGRFPPLKPFGFKDFGAHQPSLEPCQRHNSCGTRLLKKHIHFTTSALASQQVFCERGSFFLRGAGAGSTPGAHEIKLAVAGRGWGLRRVEARRAREGGSFSETEYSLAVSDNGFVVRKEGNPLCPGLRQ